MQAEVKSKYSANFYGFAELSEGGGARMIDLVAFEHAHNNSNLQIDRRNATAVGN